MTISYQRSWLIVMIGGPMVWRCGRALRRRLPLRRVVVIGVRPGRFDKNAKVLLKPLNKPVSAIPFTGRMPDSILEHAMEVAVSARDQHVLTHEFGSSLGSVGTDVVILVDPSEPWCGPIYRLFMQHLARQRVLTQVVAKSVRLRVFLVGARPVPVENQKAFELSSSDMERVVDHTITLCSSSIDGLSMSPQALADSAGDALGTIIELEPNHPVRSMFRRLPENMSLRKSYWSLGYSTATGRGDELIHALRRYYSALLGQRWRKRQMSEAQVRKRVRQILCQLLDSNVSEQEMPRLFARWAASCFCQPLSENEHCGRTPADLHACLVEAVRELAARSAQISADLPHRPAQPVRPPDPRGWLRRLLNRLTGNRFFRWQWSYEAPPDSAIYVTARRRRLAVLYPPIMSVQLATQQALDSPLSMRKRDESFPAREDGWPIVWIKDLLYREHSRVVSALRCGILTEALLSGVDPITRFGDVLLKQLVISADDRGLDLIRAFNTQGQEGDDWIRRLLASLAEQAAPRWDRPCEPGTEEHDFACLPRSELPVLAELGSGIASVVPWDRQSYGVIRFLQGCVPESLSDELETRHRPLTLRSRDWLPGAEVQADSCLSGQPLSCGEN